jgi:hypothetical protein
VITADESECSKSLQEYRIEVERKLKAMVSGFAREIAETASSKTTIGDETKLYDLYAARELARGIDAKAGFHKGAWVYTEGGLTFDPKIYSTGMMANEVEYQAQANYKIGDSFSIGAEGTAYEMLQERDDIEGETLSAIQTAHKADLKRFYDEG